MSLESIVSELKQERDVLDRWWDKKSPADLAAYRAEHNGVSIDRLPALEHPSHLTVG